MNRNLLKWVLVILVVAAAAAYLFLSGGKKDKGDKEWNDKVEMVEGHSKAFTIEPVEGITISAPENALDKDRKFKVKPAGKKISERVADRLLKEQDVKTLFVLDVNAGLAPDKYFPGDYDVVMDLDKMGIPRSIQPLVQVYRIADEGKQSEYYRYVTHVENGKLSFRSNQNSLWSVTVDYSRKAWEATAWAGGKAWEGTSWVLDKAGRVLNVSGAAIGAVGSLTPALMSYTLPWDVKPFSMAMRYLTETMQASGHSVSLYFADRTSIAVPVRHESGEFMLYFRYKDTEKAGEFKDYLKATQDIEDRNKVLEERADSAYNARVQAKIDTVQKGYSFWQKLFSRKEVEEIRASIDRTAILNEYLEKDQPRLANLKAVQLSHFPQTVACVIDGLINASIYLNDIGFKKNNFVTHVYLGRKELTTEDNTGVARKHLLANGASALLQYDIKDLVLEDGSLNMKRIEKLKCTIVHELSHVRQQCHHSMSSTANECTATVLERDACRLWYGKKLFQVINPDSYSAELNLITSRYNKFLYGYPFEEFSGGLDGAYVRGDAMEGIRESAGKTDVNMCDFASSYAGYGPQKKEGWKGWIKHTLGISDEQYDKGWIYFGEKFIERIFDSQGSEDVPRPVRRPHFKLTPSRPTACIDRLSKPRDYSVSTFTIGLPDKAKDETEEPANVFIYRVGGKPISPWLTFCWSDLEFKDCTEKKEGDTFLVNAKPSIPFYAGNRDTDFFTMNTKAKGDVVKKNKKQGYQLGIISTTASKDTYKEYYYIAALFRPDAPRKLKAKKDELSFVVPKASGKLVKKNLISGAVATVRFADGTKITRDISPDSFGKKYTIKDLPGISGKDFEVSLHWYYKPSAETEYYSPESKPAVHGAMPEEEKVLETANVVTVDEKKGYWKQVGSKLDMENSTMDADLSFENEDLKNHRYIMFMPDGDKEYKFTADGTTAEVVGSKTVYTPATLLDGSVCYTEPPKQWAVNTNYTCEWYTDEDPYVYGVDKPFTFQVENSTSAPAACEMGKDKVTEKNSKQGSMKWLNQVKTVFKTKEPGKDGPRGFTIVQKYTIGNYAGSREKASIMLTYNYEWVEGEMEEEARELESMDEPAREEPAVEEKEEFLHLTGVYFYAQTNEEFGKEIQYTSYDKGSFGYDFRKDYSSSSFLSSREDSSHVFSSVREGDYQIVKATFRRNDFVKVNSVDDYRKLSSNAKRGADEEFTLTVRISKDRIVDGTFSGTRKSHAAAGSWPDYVTTCTASISGSFGPEKYTQWGAYQQDIKTVNSFSLSVGGFQAYVLRPDGLRYDKGYVVAEDGTHEFNFSTTSTNARISLGLYFKNEKE